jgi:RNA recognition motif-containing protein
MVKRKRDANKIIVVGLPEGTDNEALESMFSDLGKIYACHVVGLDAETGKSRGYGFVTFAEAAMCDAAVARMHKTIVEGRTINVRLVEERDASKAVLESGKGVGVGKDANKVLVAGLSQTMTDERLQLMCEEFGLVLKATVVMHATTGKSRGFGFVTFTNRACQQACITKLDKREVSFRLPEPGRCFVASFQGKTGAGPRRSQGTRQARTRATHHTRYLSTNRIGRPQQRRLPKREATCHACVGISPEQRCKR